MRTISMLFLLIIATMPLQAAIIHVPQDQSTIQGGINAALESDTVLVAPAHYTENLYISGKGITLMSATGRDSTIISPLNLGSDIVFIHLCAGHSNTIKGFTFTGATRYSCIESDGGNVDVLNCSFVGNWTSADFKATLDLGFGNYIVRGNHFENNQSGDQGGGIQMESAVYAIVENNEFIRNTAVHGAGISMTNSVGAIVRRNLLVANEASYYGGAIFVGTAVNSQIYNNTIDSCVSSGFVGGGIALAYSSADVVYSNIIIRCSGYGIFVQSSSNCDIDFNDVYYNTPAEYSGITPPLSSISLDPQFWELPVDYHLNGDSPCIDAGNPQPQFNDVDGSRADMGAFPVIKLPPSSFDLLGPPDTFLPPLVTRIPTLSWTQSFCADQTLETVYEISYATDSSFSDETRIFQIYETAYTFASSLELGTEYWWKVAAYDRYGHTRLSNQTNSFRIYLPGDINADDQVSITDIVYLINFLFAGAAAPIPLVVGDTNCDSRINISDAVFLVNYIFASGPPPCQP